MIQCQILYSDRTWTLMCTYFHCSSASSTANCLELTSLRKYLVHQGVSVSARSLSSFLCRSSRARLCSVALSMSPSRRDSVTCCHSLLQNKLLASVFKSCLSLTPGTYRITACGYFRTGALPLLRYDKTQVRAQWCSTGGRTHSRVL